VPSRWPSEHQPLYTAAHRPAQQQPVACCSELEPPRLALEGAVLRTPCCPPTPLMHSTQYCVCSMALEERPARGKARLLVETRAHEEVPQEYQRPLLPLFHRPPHTLADHSPHRPSLGEPAPMQPQQHRPPPTPPRSPRSASIPVAAVESCGQISSPGPLKSPAAWAWPRM
jgi:hypothetical protein